MLRGVRADECGWLLAIRRTEAWDAAPSWREAFLAAGARLFDAIEPTFFDPDGQMYAHGRPVGRYRFFGVDEAEAAFGGRGWFRLAPPCEWVGRVEGFLGWEWWTERDQRLFDIGRFLAASNGYVVRLRDDLCFDAIASHTYRLADAHAKHGFGDGGDLPELGAAYDAYVWRTIEHALAELGLVAKRITYGTGHNRIRFDELVPAGRASLREAWARFDAHRDDPLQLWAYNQRRDELERLVDD